MAKRWTDPFIQLLVDESVRQFDLVFVPGNAEGNLMPDPPGGLEVEEWSGWLVPPAREDEALTHCPFDDAWFASQGFSSAWVTWSANADGTVAVQFEVIPPGE